MYMWTPKDHLQESVLYYFVFLEIKYQSPGLAEGVSTHWTIPPALHLMFWDKVYLCSSLSSSSQFFCLTSDPRDPPVSILQAWELGIHIFTSGFLCLRVDPEDWTWLLHLHCKHFNSWAISSATTQCSPQPVSDRIIATLPHMMEQGEIGGLGTHKPLTNQGTGQLWHGSLFPVLTAPKNCTHRKETTPFRVFDVNIHFPCFGCWC